MRKIFERFSKVLEREEFVMEFAENFAKQLDLLYDSCWGFVGYWRRNVFEIDAEKFILYQV